MPNSIPNLQVYSGPNSKLAMSFDIGTTFSGVSYCVLRPGLVPEILGVNKFPGHGDTHGNCKVPSLLYYDEHGNLKAAGAEVLTETNVQAAQEEGWTKAEWFVPNCVNASGLGRVYEFNPGGLTPLPTGKTAVSVLADFIKYLFQCAKAYIEEHHPFTWSSLEDSIEYIFTHPNGWEGTPQQLYRRAIVHAGLIPLEGQSRVHMLTEGEASLHFCVPNLLNSDATNQAGPQGVVIVDAGGGTVDLSMYSMTTNPVSCNEIAPAECQLQGSVFVTQRARDLLQKKLGGWNHTSDEDMDEFTREFDSSTKLIIKTDQEPAYVRVAGRRYTNAAYGIKLGKLRLSGEEATGLFDASIDAIINAFEQQEKRATIPITVAFLVGGLSANDWLWSRLRLYFEGRNVKIYRPDNHINKAVAHGAVLSHIDRENHLIASRVARATYGVVCALPVKEDDEEHVLRKAHWEEDPSGDRYVPGFFEAKLRRGDQVSKEMEFRESFSLTESDPEHFGAQTVRLVCYRGDASAPQWVDKDRESFSIFCTIQVDLRQATKDLVKRTASGKVCYQLDYAVIVHFGFTELKAFLGWKARRGRSQVEEKVPATVSFSD